MNASAELAEIWGRTDEQKRAADQISGCVMSTYNIELQVEADRAGIEYRCGTGPTTQLGRPCPNAPARSPRRSSSSST